MRVKVSSGIIVSFSCIQSKLPVKISAAVVAAEGHLQPLDVGRQQQVEQVEDRLAVVAVHPRGETLHQEEARGVLQKRGPHTCWQLLQEKRPQLAPIRGIQ